MKKPASCARRRAELIMKVRCGLMSATEAAAELGVSRKTYYKWERKGLAGLLTSVRDRPCGRSQKPCDSERQQLEKQIVRLQRDNTLLHHKMALKDLVSALDVRSPVDRTKKNERIIQLVARIETMKRVCGVSYKRILKMAGVSYAGFMRWRRRIGRNEAPLVKPGPQKVAPLNLHQLEADIAALHHRKKRSQGAVALQSAYSASVSRRQVNAMIRSVRADHNHDHAASVCTVKWHLPNLVWAVDGCRYDQANGIKLHLQNIQDLCSRYKLPPLASGCSPCGEEISGHLARHFARFGPPLFCKRDNAGNLNHQAVNELLEQHMVVPINSPVYNAPYNGAIEHCQWEIKNYLKTWRHKAITADRLALPAELAAHELNHQPRRSLKTKTSCQAYFGKNRLRYTKRQRESVYHWVRELAVKISASSGLHVISPFAWRVAAKTWLVKNNLITIVKEGKVLPHFCSDLCYS